MTSDFYLQLENFSPAQVLENRLSAALAGTPMESSGKLASLAQPFLEAVAAPTAAPGGGSVAALAGALGASLGEMVAGLSRKKKSQVAFVEPLSAALGEFQAAAVMLTKAIDRDAASFNQVIAAFKLPQETPEDKRVRDATIEKATGAAAEVPMQVAEQAMEVYEQLGQLESMSSASMLSDLRVGRLMAAAAVRGALENVAINLSSLKDSSFVAAMRSRATTLESRLSENSLSEAAKRI
jgi:formiminotetrahydrofolate cyclodeaminase